MGTERKEETAKCALARVGVGWLKGTRRIFGFRKGKGFVLISERLLAYRELCCVELQRTVNTGPFTTTPVYVCHPVEF
jgi:hypothetical protein